MTPDGIDFSFLFYIVGSETLLGSEHTSSIDKGSYVLLPANKADRMQQGKCPA